MAPKGLAGAGEARAARGRPVGVAALPPRRFVAPIPPAPALGLRLGDRAQRSGSGSLETRAPAAVREEQWLRELLPCPWSLRKAKALGVRCVFGLRAKHTMPSARPTRLKASPSPATARTRSPHQVPRLQPPAHPPAPSLSSSHPVSPFSVQQLLGVLLRKRGTQASGDVGQW